MLTLGNGNPGALQVLVALSHDDHVLLQSRGITGEAVWLMFKDACDSNIEHMRFELRQHAGAGEKATNDDDTDAGDKATNDDDTGAGDKATNDDHD